MKKFLVALFILLPGMANAYDFKIVGGNVVFARWKAVQNGVDVIAYSNAERNAFITASPSTAPLVIGDFADATPDAVAVLVANQMTNVGSISQVNAELDKIKTKAGVIDLVDGYEDKVSRLVRLNQRYGFNVVSATAALQTKIDIIRAAYAGAQ